MDVRDEKNILDHVIGAVGREILSCYQCYKCSAGCPVAYTMDLLPHRVIRAVLFNQEEKVLSCKTIWVCATCETCTARCPNEIDIAGVMDVLRQRHRQKGMSAPEPKVPVFHSAFLGSIEKTGRVHELSMLRDYSLKSGDWKEKLATGEWKNDVRLGIKMFIRGKLKIFPSACSAKREVREIFNKANEQE